MSEIVVVGETASIKGGVGPMGMVLAGQLPTPFFLKTQSLGTASKKSILLCETLLSPSLRGFYEIRHSHISKNHGHRETRFGPFFDMKRFGHETFQ